MERTLADITGALEATIFAEEIARQPGVLQALDSRAKIVGFLALLLAVSLSRNLLVILGLYVLTLALARLSEIPMGFFVKRVWLFMPFFTGIIALPALFNLITPGRPVLTLLHLAQPPLYLAVTEPGLRTATFLIMRVATSVSLAVLLILTTRWTTLLKALRVLKVPQVFLLILGMTHRYVFLLLHTANAMFLARQSRVVGRLSGADNRRWMAASLGTLLGKSYHLSEEVYLAMQSRGFRGEAQVMDPFRMRLADWLWGMGFVVVAGLAVAVG